MTSLTSIYFFWSENYFNGYSRFTLHGMKLEDSWRNHLIPSTIFQNLLSQFSHPQVRNYLNFHYSARTLKLLFHKKKKLICFVECFWQRSNVIPTMQNPKASRSDTCHCLGMCWNSKADGSTDELLEAFYPIRPEFIADVPITRFKIRVCLEP